jgi:hypothetical protein
MTYSQQDPSHLAKFQPWTAPNVYHCLHADTIDHLQRTNCNKTLVEFRISLKDSINTFFERHKTPQRFRLALNAAIDDALSNDKGDEDNYDHQQGTPWPCPKRLQRSQEEIGLRLITRGFLSIFWRKMLLSTLHAEQWQILYLSFEPQDMDQPGKDIFDSLVDTSTEDPLLIDVRTKS